LPGEVRRRGARIECEVSGVAVAGCVEGSIVEAGVEQGVER
jgi:hypothetical protein